MTSSVTADQYRIPTSREAVTRVAESAPSTDIARAYEEAMNAALGVHQIDPSDIDRKRTESLGAASLIQTPTESTPRKPERYFDPRDMDQLLQVGTAIVHLRQLELAAS